MTRRDEFPSEVIRKARGTRSQDWLAREVGVTTRTVIRWENEEQPQYPSDEHIPEIERALGITIPPKPKRPGPLAHRLQELEAELHALRDEYEAFAAVVEDRLGLRGRAGSSSGGL